MFLANKLKGENYSQNKLYKRLKSRLRSNENDHEDNDDNIS